MNYNNAHTWCRYDCRKPHYNLQAPLLQKHLITECGASAEIKCGSCKWVVNASPTLSGRIFDIEYLILCIFVSILQHFIACNNIYNTVLYRAHEYYYRRR